MSLLVFVLIPVMGLHVLRTVRRAVAGHQLHKVYVNLADTFGLWVWIWLACLGIDVGYAIVYRDGENNWTAVYFFIGLVVSAIGTLALMGLDAYVRAGNAK